MGQVELDHDHLSKDLGDGLQALDGHAASVPEVDHPGEAAMKILQEGLGNVPGGQKGPQSAHQPRDAVSGNLRDVRVDGKRVGVS